MITIDLRLWHERLGHMNTRDMAKLSISGAVRGLPRFRSDAKLPYKEYKERVNIYEDI